MSQKIVIIGGGTAGASAAFSARKADRKADIVVLDKDTHSTYSRCGLPFAIKGVIPGFENLIVFNEKFYRAQKINHRLNTTVTSIKPEAKQVLFRQDNRKEQPARPDGCSSGLVYDALIIATGARPVMPDIEGLPKDNVFTLRTIDDAKAILTAAEASGSAVVIGASFIGVELAEALKERGLEVTLIGAGRIMWRVVDEEISRIIKQHFAGKGLRIVEGERVQRISSPEHGGKLCVETGHTQGGPASQVQADLIVLSKGIRPEVTLAKEAGIETGKTGGIKVNEHLETNLKDIYAAGDCAEVISPITTEPVVSGLGTVATRQGMVAGANAAGLDDVAPSVFNTSICRIFGLEIGSIGFTESYLKEEHADKFAPVSVTVRYPSLPHYYPGGTDVHVKLIADGRSSQLLGAQIVGQDSVAQRINTLAVAFEKKCTVNELMRVDFCYSPPVTDLWNPLAVAAQSLSRKITKIT